MPQDTLPHDPNAERYLIDAIRLAMENVRERRTWPFGAVIARDGEVIATARNEVEALCDPSAHAEMQAVRAAARALNSTDLSGCTVYASGYPCPMCLAAMVGSGIETVYYAFDNADAAPYDMSSDAAYAALGLALEPTPVPLIRVDTEVTAAQMYGDAPANAD